MTKSEVNYIKMKLFNKRWETGSLSAGQRRSLIYGMIDKGYIDKNLNVTTIGHTEYLKFI